MINLILKILSIIFIYMTIGFIISRIKKSNSIADIFWAPGFIILAFYTLYYSTFILPRKFLVTTLVIIWGIRLAYYMFIRNWYKPEDIRYTNMKKNWGYLEPVYSYFIVFLLQGLLIILISLPVMIININNSQESINFLDLIGLVFWIIGFLFESVGDYQLKKFISNPENNGKIMKYGLWAYTRHPNYFGESLIWWSIWILSISAGGFFSVISPVIITFLLLFVSGVPMAEKLFDNNAEYLDYKRKTSMFFPWFKGYKI